MDLRALTDDGLLSATERLAREERGLLTSLLHHLGEVDRRRLYVTLGYKSLFVYAVRRLGYPEDQAYRRVAAMRLMKELPEVEEKIHQGALSLTSLSKAKVVFRRLDAIKEQKREILGKLEFKSTREVERILAVYVPMVRPDQVRASASDLVEFRFSGPRTILAKLEEVRGLLAHRVAEPNLGQIFEILCDFGIAALRPAAPRAAMQQTKGETKGETKTKPLSRTETRRLVWQRAGYACERCRSKHALQIDHIIPRAKGGTNEAANLRLLCRACNQRAAIEEFGQAKMDSFLS